MPTTYRQLVVKYGADITDALKGAERVNAAVDTSARAIKQSFGEITSRASALGAGMTVGVTLPLVMIGKAAIDADKRFDSLSRGMTAVTGSAATTTQEFMRLREVAKLPGLGFEEALRGSINLQAAGMSADQAAKSLSAFGNALATVGQGKDALQMVNIALVQLMNRASGFGQEIRQLQNWLPQIRKIMMDAFGTADSEAIGKSGITGAQFVAAITSELEKLPRMTGGVQNAFENMEDAVNRALAGMGKSAEPTVLAITGAIESLANAAEGLTDAEKKIIGIGAVTVATLGPAITMITQTVAAWGTYKTTRLILQKMTEEQVKSEKAKAAATAEAAQATTQAASADSKAAQAANARVMATYRVVAALEAQKRATTALPGSSTQIVPFSGGIKPFTNWAYFDEAKSYNEAANAKYRAIDASKAIVPYYAAEATAVKATITNVRDVIPLKQRLASATIGVGTAMGAMAAKAAPALATLGRFGLYGVIAGVGLQFVSALHTINKGLEDQETAADHAAEALERYRKKLDKIGSYGFGMPKSKEQTATDVLNEVRKNEKAYAQAKDALYNDEYAQTQRNLDKNLGDLERKRLKGDIWAGVKSTSAGWVRSAADVFTDTAGGATGYDIYKREYERKKKEVEQAGKMLEASRQKMREMGLTPSGAFTTTQQIIDSQMTSAAEQAKDFEVAALKAVQLGDDAGKAWADINRNYYKKLADNVKAAEKDPEFDKAYADMLALEEYRADKAEMFRKRQKEAEAKRLKDDADARQKAAELLANRRTEAYSGASIEAMRFAAKREKLEASLAYEKDPAKIATTAKELADMQYGVAAIDAMVEYRRELDALNDAKAKGLDITNQLALAQLKYTSAVEAAAIAATRTREQETTRALELAQEKMDAIRKESDAERDKAMAQVGFTSLRGMWEKGMIEGQKARFAENNTGQTAGREQIRELQNLVSFLKDELPSKLGRELAAIVRVN